MRVSELAELHESLGFTEVRTYVQSGNVVFSRATGDPASLAKRIESRLKARMNLDVTVLIRTPGELGKLVDRNPFANREQSRLYVTFLSKKPNHIPTDKIDSARAQGEEYHIFEREVSLFLPYGSGRTKLSNGFFEKTLDVRATTRNWNTVTTLLRMAKPPPVRP